MIKYVTLIVFAVCYIIYGICGLAGIQQVPKNIKIKAIHSNISVPMGLYILLWAYRGC